MKTHRVPWSTQSLESIFSVEFDTRIFHEWLSSATLVTTERMDFPEDVYDIITETIDVKSGEVWLLNHPAPTPALKATIDGFFESSTWFELPKWGEPQPVEQFESKAQELKAAAVWALRVLPTPNLMRHHIEQLQEDKAELEYRLREAFNCLESEYTALPVTFSRGLELSKVPVFRDLLLFLRLLEKPGAKWGSRTIEVAYLSGDGRQRALRRLLIACSPCKDTAKHC